MLFYKKIIKIIVLFSIILKTKCSLVIDEFYQKDFNISEYCSEIGVCKEGTHVMCTHYDAKHKMGPLCTGVKNATMTEDYAVLLLDLVNAIRSRAARGLAMGYDKELLPRAYGLFRLQWDPELATLAQVWANQCIIQFDNCRATKKFSDPGQLASITRFISSKWLPLSKHKKMLSLASPGFNTDTMLYALKASVRSWFSTHEEIDSETIKDRTSSWNDELLRNPYLQIVDGSVTHMGCGTSAFKEYRYYTETTHLIYNVVRLVCNFSSRVHDRRGIYNIDPPTKPEYTANCGCPPGYDEDSGCLCYESNKNKTRPCKNMMKTKKLQVVVVPIITVEDYPNANEDTKNNHKKYQIFNKTQNQSNVIESRRSTSFRQLNKNLSASSIFKLPSRKLKGDIQLNNIKKDVAPRKDFSKSKKLLSNYLSKRKTFNLQNKVLNIGQDEYFRRSLPIKPFKPHEDNIRRKIYHPKYKEKSHNIIQGQKFNPNIEVSKEEDTKLLNLLNKLENEANYLNVNKKGRSVLNNDIHELFKALKNSRLINNNKNIIYNKQKTDKKQFYEPFIENNKLTIYEDLFKNITSRQRNLKPKNFSLFSKKYQNNTHLRNSLTGKGFSRYSYNKYPHLHTCKTPPKTDDMYIKDFLRNYMKSDEQYFPDSKRIYYHNIINDIRRKLRTNYIDHIIESGREFKIRPTIEASHLQFRQTLPKF